MQAFVQSCQTPKEAKRGKKPAVKVVVSEGLVKEFQKFDLPSIEKPVKQLDFNAALALWRRFVDLRMEESRLEYERELARIDDMETELLLL